MAPDERVPDAPGLLFVAGMNHRTAPVALAQSAGTAGPVLHALMSQAFSAAKRVRSETLVGRLAVSISYAAVELARRIFEGLEGKSVLLVGAGEMSELAARHLIDLGALPVYVAN